MCAEFSELGRHVAGRLQATAAICVVILLCSALGAALAARVTPLRFGDQADPSLRSMETTRVTDNLSDMVAQADTRHRRALFAAHDCSVSGYEGEEIPTSAIIRDAQGTRLVSFDHGWAVLLGEREGSLVAVCRG